MGWPWQKKQEWKPEIADEISSRKLRRILKKLAPDAIHLHCSDGTYNIPANPQEIMDRFSPTDFIYKKDEKDCDDAVRIFIKKLSEWAVKVLRGNLSEAGIGNTLAMDCIIKIRDRGYHGCIAFLQDGELVYGSAQRRKIVDYDVEKIHRLIA